MNMELDTIKNWFTDNKLSITASKTNYMFFCSKMKYKNDDQLHNQLGDDEIIQVSEYKYPEDVHHCYKVAGAM